MFEFNYVKVLPFCFINFVALRLMGRILCVDESIRTQDRNDERFKGFIGLACCVASYSSLMYLGFLLGFVEDLVPMCLGALSKFICNGKFLGKLKFLTIEFVYL
jgi:hypothetical protein